MAASISFQRANNLFLVYNGGLEPKRVFEQQLRAIGDMDINDAIERAWMNPYDKIQVRSSKPAPRRRFFA